MNKPIMKTFDKFKANLRQVNDMIFSYDSHVATINHDDGTLEVFKAYRDYSVTTSKQINFVACQYGLGVVYV